MITALIALYFIGFIIVAIITSWMPLGWMIAGVAVPLCLLGVMVYVLVERVKEII